MRDNRGGRFSSLKIRLLIAGAIVLFSFVGYMSRTDRNRVTGEYQRVGGMTIEQEVAIGLESVPEMSRRHLGPSRDLRKTAMVQQMGMRLVNSLEQKLAKEGRSLPYRFRFHLLADPRTVNAFALPGGQVFITEALYDKFGIADPADVAALGPERAARYALEGQLCGVLGHEIGHVVERHSAERMAKGQVLNSMIGAAGVAGGNQSSAQIASMVGNLISIKYGREDEYESDKWGVQLMVYNGYDPKHMLEVMDILAAATGGRGQPEFLSTHPLPENRKKHIEDIVESVFQNNLPGGLK